MSPATAPNTLAPRAWIVFGLCMAFYIFTMFLRACPAILALDLRASFAVEESSIALISSATLVGYAIMQLPSGLITDLVGGRKTMTLFLLAAAASTALFAVSTSLPAATAARFVTGLSLAAIPAAGATLSRFFPQEKFATVMSLIMASGVVGNLLAALPLAELSILVGWRSSMLAAAGICLLLGAAMFILVREPGGTTSPARTTAAKPAVKSKGRASLFLKTLLHTPQFFIITLWNSCTAMVYFSFMTMWAGPFMMQACGFTKLETAQILLFQGVLNVAAIPLLTSFGKKPGTRKRVVILTSAGGLGACLLLMLAGPALGKAGLVLACMLLASCATAGATCTFAQLRTYFPRELLGTAIGTSNMIWPALAAVLGYVFGLAFEGRKSQLLGADFPPLQALQGGYAFALGIYAALWLIALLLAVFCLRERFTVRVSDELSAHLQQA